MPKILTEKLNIFSSVTLASKFVPFINNMLLGRTFDFSKSEVGNDIISEAERKKAFKVQNDRSDIKYKMIRSSQDVRDVLDVSGQLSVKVMAGTVNVEGKGSYLKSSVDSESSVEVMVQVYYKTVTKTLHDGMTLLNNWDSKGVTGQHYIRSLVYGGYLIASFKYLTSNDEEKEDIKASVSVDVKTVKAEVGVKGLFSKLSSLSKSQSSLTITYTSSVISDKVPVDLDTLMEVIDNFNAELAKINGGEGVPLLAEIRELSFLRDNAANEKFKFLKNSMLTQQMDVLASMFHDLKVTSDALTDAVEDVEMTVAQEEKYGGFNYRLSKISDSFYKAIQNLDLNALSKTGSATQFSEAINAYKEKKEAFLPGKFLREFQKFKKENPIGDPVLNGIRTKLVDLREKVGTLDLRFSGEESAIVFPQTGDAAYLITKGAPEMSNIMVCFSSRSLTEKTPQTYFSYSVPSSNHAFKAASDADGRMMVFWGTSQVKFGTSRKLIADDREWHSWCFYWDDSGTTIVYRDADLVGEKDGIAVGKKVPAGGTWVVGNEKVNEAKTVLTPFKGEITNVNVYGNFDKNEFQKDAVAYRVTSSTCRPSIYKNIIKSWNDFKIGFAGDLKVLSKNFCT
ncbi:Hypothetical predicted protein [Paramuricea clavata]|uniref:Pentraxin (PTX) domain-containing protein n=1 Tax=Paramuricea clavata TaxID=317549 RepID=A0A7D9EFX1_PARCT|nr:Hypothetical predicted protein [Paramuricea clavata]